jgi:hypothetical protein
MFLPVELRPHLNRLRVNGPDGRPRPVVIEERLVYDSDRFPVPAAASNWLPWYLTIGLLVGATLLASGRRVGQSRGARWAFLGLGLAWSTLAGLGGAILIFLWGFTDHRFSVANENVLQLTLFSLALAAVLPGAVRLASRRPRIAAWLGGAAAASSVAGLALKLAPGFSQANLDMIALAAPAHLGLLGGLLGIRGRAGR